LISTSSIDFNPLDDDGELGYQSSNDDERLDFCPDNDDPCVQ